MKRLIIITGIIVSGLLSSCSDFADDYFDTPAESSLDEALIFSNPILAKSAVDGIKMPIGEDQSYRNRWLLYYGLNTDVEWYNNSQTVGAKSDLCVYDAKSNNSEMNRDKNVWAQMYAGIERANLCIRGLRTYGNPTPGSELGYLLGESLALRAFYYADLVKTWGDVPARFEPLTGTTIYVARANRDIIYKQLIADLGEAATLVPWPGDSDATKSTERINKAFVKGLRARLALAASGYQQYPDGGTYGTVRRSTDPELSVDKMYTIALKECRDVIGSGKARLEVSFEKFWKNYHQEILTAGGESLWEMPFQAGRGQILRYMAVKHNTTNQFQALNKSTGGSAGPLPNVFYDYKQTDTRRDVTCVPYFYDNAVSGVAQQKLGKLNTWYFGKYRYEWMGRKVTTDDCGMNKIYMRYAEVLLMAAEAANELEGPAAAAPYLKEIRNRAFLPADRPTEVEAYVDAKIASKEDMFNAIVDEYAFEFTGEMERKQCLIRWNLLKVKMDEAKDRMKQLQGRTGAYADVPTKLYYKFASDNVTLEVYGLNRGETTDPGAGYTSVSWTWSIDPADSGAVDNAKKRESLYRNDPNTRQYWPIWDYFINSSNDMLLNQYGY